MPRYFFHYRRDDELIRDPEGQEFDNLDAAEHNAAEMGRAIVDRALSLGEDPRLPRSIEITDATARQAQDDVALEAVSDRVQTAGL